MPETGVIHDIGYQRYEGVRLGRGYAARSIYVHSLRTAFGLGRNVKAKMLPVGLFALSCIAALILVVISSQLPQPVITYVGIVSTFTYGITAFVAMVAPELVSRDLRNTLLPLYFSRPPRRMDYALAKLAALVSASFVMFAGPLLLMFIGMAFSTPDGIAGVFDQLGELLPGIGAALIHSVVISAIALPLASLTGRRVFATGLIIGVFLLTAPLSGAMQQLGDGDDAALAGLINPVSLLNGVDSWLFSNGNEVADDMVATGSYGPVYGLAALLLTAAGTALLMWRYKKVKS
jgi:ABC-2 type transport system permease protein